MEHNFAEIIYRGSGSKYPPPGANIENEPPKSPKTIVFAGLSKTQMADGRVPID